jgi:hypothetical protein
MCVVTTYRAAWVPDGEPDRDWDVAVCLAVDWIERQRARAPEGATAMLVTNTVGVESSVPSLARFAQRHRHTTPRSRGHVGRGVGPVLAYVPDARAMELAISLASGSSLVVVEGDFLPVRGWALEVGAVDLTMPDDQPKALDPRPAEAIER